MIGRLPVFGKVVASEGFAYGTIKYLKQNLATHKFRPVTRGGAWGAFAPSPQAPKVRILILNIQVKELQSVKLKFQT